MADSQKKAAYEKGRQSHRQAALLAAVRTSLRQARTNFTAPVVVDVDLFNYNGAADDPIMVRIHDDFKDPACGWWWVIPTGLRLKSGQAVETPANGER